jgi:hypothetical protein
MNKNDLKTGMIGKTRGGNFVSVYKDTVFGKNYVCGNPFGYVQWWTFASMSDDLLHRTDSLLDIIELYTPKIPVDIGEYVIHTIKTHYIKIWEREVIKEVVIDGETYLIPKKQFEEIKGIFSFFTKRSKK